MGSQIVQIKGAIFRGRIKEAKRWTYQFDNPDGGDYPLKVGAFEPNVPQLSEGVAYDFPMELKPVPNEEGKFYRNFTRKVKDGICTIFESGKSSPIESSPLAEKPATMQQTGNKKTATETMSKAEWAAKDRKIAYGGMSHDAAQIVTGFIMQGIVKTKEEASAMAVALTKDFMQGEDKDSEEFVQAQEMGGLKSPKEEKKD